MLQLLIVRYLLKKPLIPQGWHGFPFMPEGSLQEVASNVKINISENINLTLVSGFFIRVTSFKSQQHHSSLIWSVTRVVCTHMYLIKIEENQMIIQFLYECTSQNLRLFVFHTS